MANEAAGAASAPVAPGPVGGYNGKLLRVNLTANTAIAEPISETICRRYIGGAGFIAYYLWKELKTGIDPLGPDNKLIFALGPITGMLLPGASRNCIGAMSPLTGGIAKAEVGGHWMAELKRAGYDAIIVEGKAKKPVYLWVHDGEAEIKDAAHLWGQELKETEAMVRAELGDEKIHLAMIGPGGENLVRFACVMEGCYDAAGRGGLGAVMGSKNLKAIAARGHNLPPVVDAEKVKEIRQQMMHPYGLSDLGTGAGGQMAGGESGGDLPIRNFRDGVFPEVKQITASVIKDSGMRTGMDGCFACPVRCKKVCKLEGAMSVDPAYGGPEYETLAALGSDCGVGDLNAVVKGNERCGAYSLDTISCGSTIAFAMECFEKGLITKKDTDGLELKFGNADAMLKAIELITYRKGIGNLMAEGTARMAKKIGKGCEDFTLHVKGLEPGMHDPRVGSALALNFMIDATGANHCGGVPDGALANEMVFKKYHPFGMLKPESTESMSPKKVAIYKMAHLQAMMYDCLVVCHFPGQDFVQTEILMKAITGWDTGITEILLAAERTVTLMRLFNLKHGIKGSDDVLPKRFHQPKTGGRLATLKYDSEGLEKAKQYFYALMCWDSNGVPLPARVKDLDID